MTRTESRRLGRYHTGQQTVVVGVRMPVETRDRLREKAADSDKGSVSQYVEWLIETQSLRDR